MTFGLSDEEAGLLESGEGATANPPSKQAPAPEAPKVRRRKGETPDAAEAEKSDQEVGKSSDEAGKNETARGALSPAQYDDDGWGGLPVQMRG